MYSTKEKNIQQKNYTVYLPVEEFEDCYVVSRSGKVRSVDRTLTDKNGRTYTLRGKQRKINIDKNGFACVNLSREGRRFKAYVHRIVAQTWVHNPDPSTHIYVIHKDGDISNNHADNLMWVKSSLNADYIYKSGLNNKQYALKADPSEQDEYITRILNREITVTEAATEMGYTTSYASCLLRRRAKETGLINDWYKSVRTSNRARNK